MALVNPDAIELSFNSKEFGREFLTKPSMFGKLEVHASEVVWRFEPITFYIRELRVKLILPKMTYVEVFFIHIMAQVQSLWFTLFGDH